MPIPTDTFWNIKRLNVVFALSAVALLAVTAWAIFQDHEKDWRIPQRQARDWDLALTDAKIQRELTPEEKKRIDELGKELDARQSELKTHDQAYLDLGAQRKKLESEKATLDFKLSNLKSNVQVTQANLQDARAADDPERVKQLMAELAGPQKSMDEQVEQLARLTDQIAEIRAKQEQESAQVDALKKEHTRLTADFDALDARAKSIDPTRKGGVDGLAARFSGIVRDMPLMGFINPSEKIQQIVLPEVQTDVAFMKITTVDRCMTCHTNINRKEFTRENILAYLESEVATARSYNLPQTAPAGATAPSATAAKPGAAAFPEFWANWARKLAPAAVTRMNTRLAAIARSVGGTGPATVAYNGEAVATFAYDVNASDAAIVERQNDILLALFDGFYRWSSAADGVGTHGKAKAVINKAATGAPINTPRNFSLRFVEDMRNALQQALSADAFRLLEDRYRFALVDEANMARRRQGLSTLDASPVLLAHPRLELYVDVDSPHSFEVVGCTSCHDGSGQETDFVVAAHSPRDIFVDSRTGAPVLKAQLAKAPPEHDEAHNLSSMLIAAEHTKDLHFESAPSTRPAEGEHDAGRPIDYTDPVTGKTGKAETQMAYWVDTFEPTAPRSFALVYHEWDWPMRTPEFIQANCARCHTEVYDIKETAPVLYEGRQLFTGMGCVNCHQMDSIPASQNRKVGTDLRHVTAKLSPEYINTWIWAPKAFRPTTKMPHFFMLENNSSDEELRRTRQESRAMTEFLVRTATPLPPKNVYPTNLKASTDAGKALFNSIGCLGCHQNLNERGEEWITTDLVKRAGMTADAAKAQYGAMTYNERHLYVQQNLSEPAGHSEEAKYADGTVKPRFIQVGPELSGVGTKLTAGRTVDQARQWLFDWLKDTRHYSEYTFMPRLRLSDQQAIDLADYLLNQKRTTTDPNDKWSAGLTPVDSEKLRELTALQFKGRYSAQTAWAKADDDAELTAGAQIAMTTPQISADQAKALVAKMSKDEKRLIFLGQKLIASYGCMSCHAINGMETVSSPCANLSDWGQKAVSKLEFGYLDHHKLQGLPPESKLPMVNGLSAAAANLAHAESAKASQEIEVSWPHVEHSRDSWIIQKLKNTRVYDRGKSLLEPSASDPGSPYDKLKMPTFYLSDQQVHAIVNFVLSNRDRLVSEKLTQKATSEQARTIARGRELTERYNCISCHQVEKNRPQIQQYYKPEDVITDAPPSLRGEGNKIQHAWLFDFFKNVEQMRPKLFAGIRMPSFPISDEEWSAIIAYFSSVSNKESKELNKHLDPINKYIAFQRKATTQPAPADPAAPAPGDDWWQRPEFAGQAAALKEWGLQFGHIKPIQVGPTASAEDLRKVYRVLWFKAAFASELYAAPYPFVDSPRPQVTDDRFKLGEKFFYEMQCLKCHVLGDPNVNGANKAPTAPNLSLAQRRLQLRWVRHWVQDPDIIQVGTAMPPFFTGMTDNTPINVHGQSWARAQKTARSPEDVEADYGKTVDEQTALLLDFLYSAGVRGHTGVQPTTTGQ